MGDVAKANYLLQNEKFEGEIIINNQQVAISLTASTDASGRLSLDVDSIPHYSEDLRELEKSSIRPDYPDIEFGLDCKSSSGKRLKSDRVSITPCRPGSEERQIRLHTFEARLSMTTPGTYDRPVLRFRLLGFNHSLCDLHDSNLGRVEVQGAKQKTAPHEITGCVTIQAADSNTPTDCWRQEAEHLLQHLSLVLGFAQGASVPVPVTEFHEGNHVEVTFCAVGEAYPPYLPPLSHASFKSIIKAAIDNISAVDEDREAFQTFQTAINWLLVQSTYAEVEFLAPMIALEILAARFTLEKTQKSILGQSDFKKLREHIKESINHLDDATQAAIKEKIPELNRQSLHRSIDALLEKWNINRRLIDNEVIKCLISLRNKIVHEGIAPEGNDLWIPTLYVREILVRVIFAILKFDGNYQYQINDSHRRHFPGCEKRGG